MIKYHELSNEQKQTICNGCGGKGGWIDPPEFLFHASCNQHDFYYWRGGTEEDRHTADAQFYEFMKKDAKDALWYNKPLCYILSFVYYKFVRIFGKKYFEYGEMKSTKDLVQFSQKDTQDGFI